MDLAVPHWNKNQCGFLHTLFFQGSLQGILSHECSESCVFFKCRFLWKHELRKMLAFTSFSLASSLPCTWFVSCVLVDNIILYMSDELFYAASFLLRTPCSKSKLRTNICQSNAIIVQIITKNDIFRSIRQINIKHVIKHFEAQQKETLLKF